MRTHIHHKMQCYFVVLAFLIASFFAMTPSVIAQQAESGKVLAQINDRKVTLEDFADQIATVSPSLQPFVKAEKARYLEGLVEEEILYQEGMKHKLGDTADVQKQIEQARRKLVVQKLLQEEIKNKIRVSDKEISDYYNSNNRLYNLRERGRFLQIVVKEKAQAEEILGKLKKGEDFGALASKFSQDSSRARGGSLGFVERGALTEKFDNFAFALKPSQITPVVETIGGYQIIKMLDYQPAKVRALADVKEGIHKLLLANKEKKAIREYVLGLKSKSKVLINEALLKEAK